MYEVLRAHSLFIVGAYVIVSGSLWALLASLSAGFALTFGAGAVGLITAVLIAAARGERSSAKILVSVLAVVCVAFAVGALWLYLVCQTGIVESASGTVCQSGTLDMVYVVLSAIWANVVAVVVLFTGIGFGKVKPDRS